MAGQRDECWEEEEDGGKKKGKGRLTDGRWGKVQSGPKNSQHAPLPQLLGGRMKEGGGPNFFPPHLFLTSPSPPKQHFHSSSSVPSLEQTMGFPIWGEAQYWGAGRQTELQSLPYTNPTTLLQAAKPPYLWGWEREIQKGLGRGGKGGGELRMGGVVWVCMPPPHLDGGGSR